MSWEKIKENLYSTYKEAAFYIENMPRLHLLGCLLVLLAFCTRQPEPEVRIVLENNGPPVIVKQVETTKVIHKEPIVTLDSKSSKQSASQRSSIYFKVGDCFMSEYTFKRILKDASLEDWEKEEVYPESYNRITKIGKTKIQYQWYKDDKTWSESTLLEPIKGFNIDNVKVKCPDKE